MENNYNINEFLDLDYILHSNFQLGLEWTGQTPQCGGGIEYLHHIPVRHKRR